MMKGLCKKEMNKNLSDLSEKPLVALREPIPKHISRKVCEGKNKHKVREENLCKSA